MAPGSGAHDPQNDPAEPPAHSDDGSGGLSARAWTEALDAFEARLAEQRAALDAGDAGDVAAFVPPSDLGSMPASLLARAEALARESTDLVAELAGEVAHLRQDLAVVRKVEASTGRSAGARFVDTSA